MECKKVMSRKEMDRQLDWRSDKEALYDRQSSWRGGEKAARDHLIAFRAATYGEKGDTSCLQGTLGLAGIFGFAAVFSGRRKGFVGQFRNGVRGISLCQRRQLDAIP